MVAIEPGHAKIWLRCAAGSGHHSEHRAVPTVQSNAFGHGARYHSPGAAHGHAFNKRAAR